MTEPLQYDRRDDSLRMATLWVGLHLETPGVICPACGQVACMRRRYLHHSMAAALLLLVRYFRSNPDAEYVHLERLLKESRDMPAAVRGDAAKLQYWGLIEAACAENTTDPSNPHSGNYRLTQFGLAFAERRERVYEAGWMYNGTFRLDQTSELISIDDALGRHFRYDDLLS